MLKKTIKFVDYNGVDREEDHYFNISKAELAMLESSRAGGMRYYLERITQAQDTVAIMDMFKDIIKLAYGVKSPDGRRFIKNDEVYNEFAQTEAYSELIMEILKSTENALAFVQAILPKDAMMAVKQDEIKELPSLEA